MVRMRMRIKIKIKIRMKVIIRLKSFYLFIKVSNSILIFSKYFQNDLYS